MSSSVPMAKHRELASVVSNKNKPPPRVPAAAAATAALLLALAPGCSACGDSAPEPPVAPIGSLGLAMHPGTGARISAGSDWATVTLEADTRTPRTIELRRIDASVARRWPKQPPHREAPIAAGLATLSYNVDPHNTVGSGTVGSGGPEVHLTGVFELCESKFQVDCHAQGEPPPDSAWCLVLLETLRCTE